MFAPPPPPQFPGFVAYLAPGKPPDAPGRSLRGEAPSWTPPDFGTRSLRIYARLFVQRNSWRDGVSESAGPRYPTKAFRLDFRQMLTHHNHETLIPKLLPAGVKATLFSKFFSSSFFVLLFFFGGCFVFLFSPHLFCRFFFAGAKGISTSSSFFPFAENEYVLLISPSVLPFLWGPKQMGGFGT